MSTPPGQALTPSIEAVAPFYDPEGRALRLSGQQHDLRHSPDNQARTYEPFAGFNDVVRSARFDRQEYTALIDGLLTTDWSTIR